MKPTADNIPGAHERHLRRCADNPLFPAERRRVNEAALMAARQRDRDDELAFSEQLRTLVERAVALQPNEETQVVLDLKEDLDKAYEQCAGLGGEHDAERQAITQLVQVIMRTVAQGAESDPLARAELQREELARHTHYQLLREPLVADLLRPDSPIGGDELVPTLLSSDERALGAALHLFDAEQVQSMLEQARELLDGCERPLPEGAARALAQLQAHLDGAGMESMN